MERNRHLFLGISFVTLAVLGVYMLTGGFEFREDRETGTLARLLVAEPILPEAVAVSEDEGQMKDSDEPVIVVESSDEKSPIQVSRSEWLAIEREMVAWNERSNGWISPEMKAYADSLLARYLFKPEMLEIWNSPEKVDMKSLVSLGLV